MDPIADLDENLNRFIKLTQNFSNRDENFQKIILQVVLLNSRSYRHEDLKNALEYRSPLRLPLMPWERIRTKARFWRKFRKWKFRESSGKSNYYSKKENNSDNKKKGQDISKSKNKGKGKKFVSFMVNRIIWLKIVIRDKMN